MSIVPQSRLGKIEFYEAHIIPWQANAVAIGLTGPAVVGLSSRTTAARAAYNAAEAARQASKTATQAYYDAVRLMHSDSGGGADMIETIKAFAQFTGNPAVYTLAQIPPPAPPSAAPPPGTPFDFKVGLLQDGALELKWKCNNPSGTSGTVYEVLRRTGPTGPFAFVGSSGLRSFVDDTLQSGSASVTYRITAVRSTQKGHPAQVLVSFGVGGPGITIESVDGVRLAA